VIDQAVVTQCQYRQCLNQLFFLLSSSEWATEQVVRRSCFRFLLDDLLPALSLSFFELNSCTLLPHKCQSDHSPPYLLSPLPFSSSRSYPPLKPQAARTRRPGGAPPLPGRVCAGLVRIRPICLLLLRPVQLARRAVSRSSGRVLLRPSPSCSSLPDPRQEHPVQILVLHHREIPRYENLACCCDV